MAAAASPDRAHRLLVVAMDFDFYRQAHSDLTYADVDPAGHYGLRGWREGRDPAPWFSTDAYLEQNPDVAESGTNPFAHYLTIGWRQGREIVPSARAGDYYALVHGVGGTRISADERAAAAEFFDPKFYLAMNPDVAEAGGDLLDHFLRLGWREGRDPSYDFSTASYLELNPDVAASGRHPFIHYVTQGRREGRTTKADNGFRQEVLANLKPFAARVADARRWARPVELSSAEALIETMRASPLQGLHLTFSQDDYSRSVGGSQLCVQRESAEFARLGRNHLHVHPANGWPTVRSGATETPMGVLWNGKAVGAFVRAAIAQALKAATPAGPGSFAIHNMLGHSSRDVIDIVRSAGLNAGHFWLHDMGSLCAGIHLMRNDVESCGAPPQGSAACGVCVYGPARAAHVREHQRLFQRLDLTVAAPSQVALDAWRAGGDLEATGEVVAPLARLVPTGEAPRPASERPFRFAFPGTPSVHKGWPIFRHLAARFADDERYAFIHLASKPAAGALAAHHPVTVTAAEPLAMRQAMIDLEIDAAMIWSLCIETFSFAAYEAAAAGAAVVTGPDSGNVAVFAREHGLLLDDERALEALFESGEILKLARARRGAALYDLAFSKLTAELVEAT
ncbi:hypothetical protein [Phenylobacterium sp.]|uniref:hypothetical protein n=1 Tax=Phenylobacterium sp. TaxID=1871053 RepID=UPI0028A0A09F|nr:hypothetical protein [Phenylobacterium sp.]